MTLLQSLSVQKAAQFLPVDMQLAWTYSAHWKSNILVIIHIDRTTLRHVDIPENQF